jgi:hypothetical protein
MIRFDPSCFLTPMFTPLYPGFTITGDVDGFSIGTDATGKAQAFKWIDYYDATITGGGAPGLQWVAGKNAQNSARWCCCQVPACYLSEEKKKGGWFDAKAAFGSYPPPIPPMYP